ncbi:MAG: cytochrome P450 [Vitreimonas sp.]
MRPSNRSPLTHRFVKETLRLWSPPLLLTRSVRTNICAGGYRLRPGQSYLLSPHLIHHDASRWQDAKTFDPDRWLPEAPPGACPAGCYVPFGFAPRTCIGASLGATLLMLTCHLLSTEYRLRVPDPQAVRMSLAAAALPVEFVGTLTRRAG